LREDWLDTRLQAVAACVDAEAALVADIGADHGRLACALLTARPALRMIVADVSAGSLAKAQKLLEARGLLQRTELRVADGLDALAALGAGGVSAAPDAIIIAGMGGATIRGILARGLAAEGLQSAICGAKLILQPNIEAPLLREWLCIHGFPLCEETVARASGRFYVILCARRGAPMTLTPLQRALGPCLLAHRPKAFAGYLRWHGQVLARTLSRLRRARERDAAREAEIAREIAWIKDVLGDVVPDTGQNVSIEDREGDSGA